MTRRTFCRLFVAGFVMGVLYELTEDEDEDEPPTAAEGR